MTAAPWFHQLDTDPSLVLLVRSSSLLRLDGAAAERLSAGGEAAGAALRAWDVQRTAAADEVLPRPRALALNVATACNLGCAYCYADRGKFGGPRRAGMSSATMRASVDRLVTANVGRRVTLGFMGGEPFANRELIHEAVAYATEIAAANRVTVGFSVTTNGTLLRAEDVALLRRHDFTVTVSLDGDAALNDRLRPTAAGANSYAAAVAAVTPLLADPGRARVSARATLTRLELDVAHIVASVRALGFAEVGVSPLRSGPRADLALRGGDWRVLLSSMREAAAQEWVRLLAGEAPVFSNFIVAMRQIAIGSNRPLPCGAADNYVSVSAEGAYYTCHRTIDDARFRLGDVGSGLDDGARRAFLSERHVDRQEPCRSCWARYLCGGGCHAEVIDHGRDGCDYIRGWLETCLSYYDRAQDARPDLFSESG